MAKAEWYKAMPEVIPFPDHDRRYDDFYSTQQSDMGDRDFPF
jgi:hypothetical protein